MSKRLIYVTALMVALVIVPFPIHAPDLAFVDRVKGPGTIEALHNPSVFGGLNTNTTEALPAITELDLPLLVPKA